MEMLRKLSVGGAFKATGRLRNTGGQFGVQTAEEWSNMQDARRIRDECSNSSRVGRSISEEILIPVN